MSEKEFVPGLHANKPHEKAPDFIKASLSITRADLGNWLRGRQEQYINIDIKEAKSGKWYAEVNNFVPGKSKAEPAREAAQEPGRPSNNYNAPNGSSDYDDDIPF